MKWNILITIVITGLGLSLAVAGQAPDAIQNEITVSTHHAPFSTPVNDEIPKATKRAITLGLLSIALTWAIFLSPFTVYPAALLGIIAIFKSAKGRRALKERIKNGEQPSKKVRNAVSWSIIMAILLIPSFFLSFYLWLSTWL